MKTMTTTTAGLIAISAMLAISSPAQAQHGGGAWCTERSMSSWGFPNCSYGSFEQCRATASGTGAHCRPNPWLNYAESPRRKQRVRRHR
jgi:hypothetical protein